VRKIRGVIVAHLFPVFLNLEGKKCLVVGGGLVALRKIEGLLDCGAMVSVVSPAAEERVCQLADQGAVFWRQGTVEVKDIDDASMVFIATDNQEVNQRVVDWCRERRVLVNAVDDPPNCDFYVPAVVKQGSLQLAISTEGKSPLFARKLREQMEQIIGPEYGDFMDILGDLRDTVKETVPDIDQRKAIFERLVNSDILDLLKTGDRIKVEERVKECMSSWQD
ncbi:MAG: bifunctional precorrin-2 dehydrogenase/sirohydrochlorin ferrochelatase, partial [Deltaproteobacteria bacterium]